MSDTTKPALYALTPEEHATVLVALRHYRGVMAACNDKRPVTTVHGTVQPLDYDGIGTLCAGLEHTGLDFSAIVSLFAEKAEDSPYVAAAQQMASEGKFEVDEPAVVSKGDDDGAYVMGWMWVSNDAAGLTTYWTIQLNAEIPDGAQVVGGGIVPDEPIWYFDDDEEFEQAEEYAKQLGFTYIRDTTSTLPEEREFTDDLDDFKQHADLRAAERERY